MTPIAKRDIAWLGQACRQAGRTPALRSRARYEHGPNDRDPAWIALYELPELNAEAGQSWGLLGEHHRAAACAEGTVNAVQDRLPGSAQFNRVHAADAYFRVGELEQALDSARAAIPMANTLRSARSVEFVQAFADRLEPYGDTMAVREFRDHLRAGLAA